MVSILQDFFKRLLSKFIKKIELSIESNFTKGSIRVFDMANRDDLKPIGPTNKEKELLTGQIYDNIKGVTDDMNQQIKNAIRNSILEKESNIQTAKRIDDIFKGENATKINYKARLKMITKTEVARIMNAGSMKTAKRLGFTHKYLGQGGKNPYPDSLLLLNKYGGENKAIPIDEEFTITYKKVTQRFQYPPGRPNDSEMIFFTNKEDKENA